MPYRDTMDMKSPGTWFLFAAIFRWVAREIWAVQAVYLVWCLLAAPALWIAARALYPGASSATTAGAAVLLYLAAIGLFDLDYSGWMTTPYAWAFAGLLVGLRAGSRGWHVVGGMAAAVAVVFKAQAFVLAPTFVLVWLWARRRGEPGAGWIAWPLWVVGALLGLAPLLLWYAQQGAVPELLAGLFPFGIAGDYGARARDPDGWIWRIGKIPRQLVLVYPLHALLGIAALLGLWQAHRERLRSPPPAMPASPHPSPHPSPPASPPASPPPILPGLIYLAMSVVGCGVGGMRFYIHYLPQYLPALALLAAHPSALAYLRSGLRPDRAPRERLLPAALAAICVVLAAVMTVQIPLGRATRVDHKGNPKAQLAGEYIAAHTGPDDRIQVWGWAAWSVYFWADRRAPSPVFKVLGQVTEYNQNGMFSRSKSTNFRPGPAADLLLAAFQSEPPAYFVRMVPFFPGVKQDPLEQWPALRELIATRYVLRERFGKIRVYELRSRLTPEELRTLTGPPAARKKPVVKKPPRAKKRTPGPPKPRPAPGTATAPGR